MTRSMLETAFQLQNTLTELTNCPKRRAQMKFEQHTVHFFSHFNAFLFEHIFIRFWGVGDGKNSSLAGKSSHQYILNGVRNERRWKIAHMSGVLACIINH